MKKSLSEDHFSLHKISKSFINQKTRSIVVINNSISKVYLFTRMETLNFHKVCNSRIAVSCVCGIYVRYLVNKG